jgi:Bacterial virulence protein (VirJ)
MASALAALCALVVSLALPPIADRRIVLNDHALRLHFSRGVRGATHPLLVYATGDGGWHRKDLAAYHHLVAFGYPTVGFDAHDYVTHLGARPTTTPGRLAADYERIIAAAKVSLDLPADYPVVLVGVSRGAGLSVVAAGQRTLRPSIAGVLAVALTREEEYVKRFPRLRGRRRARPVAGPEMVEVYDYLPRLAATPIAVVQSTRDHYLPAAAARALFGPDTPYRWFQPIEARNHSFGGGRDQLYDAMERSLRWLAR